MRLLTYLYHWVWFVLCVIYVKVCVTFVRIKWSCWNPWAIGAMNLAWGKYILTPMYEERTKLDREFAKNQPNYNKEFAYDAFIEYNEFDFFYSHRTLADRIRLLVAPFSFGDRFRMPWWRIRWWLLGIDENELNDQDETSKEIRPSTTYSNTKSRPVVPRPTRRPPGQRPRRRF